MNGRKLLFDPSATHLGHELSRDCKMDLDAKINIANYIEKYVGIRERFSFAKPVQMIQAVEKYCRNHYGGMLWAFDGEAAG